MERLKPAANQAGDGAVSALPLSKEEQAAQ
jgi:hypothetical protein